MKTGDIWQGFIKRNPRKDSSKSGSLQNISVIGMLKLCTLIIVLVSINPNLSCAHPVDMERIAQIESSNGQNLYGSVGEIGLFQISPVCLKHYNQVHKTHHTKEDLLDNKLNRVIADWYMNWLFDRCWTVEDTLIAWNWGIGKWRRWRFLDDSPLPHEVETYLRKYHAGGITNA